VPEYRLQLINRAQRVYRTVSFSCSDDDAARVMAIVEFRRATIASAAHLWQDKRSVQTFTAPPDPG
jgi:hypothetical protein